jgi:hypothetical protein
MDTSHTIFPLGNTRSSGSLPQLPIKVTELAKVASHSTVAGGAVLCSEPNCASRCAYDANVLTDDPEDTRRSLFIPLVVIKRPSLLHLLLLKVEEETKVHQDLVVVEVTEAEAEDIIIAFSSNESLFMRIYVCVCACVIYRPNERRRALASFAFSRDEDSFFEPKEREKKNNLGFRVYVNSLGRTSKQTGTVPVDENHHAGVPGTEFNV